MYKFSISLVILLWSISGSCQNGLERVIVEKYYISDHNDTTLNSVGGKLPVGSITYRVYVDMLPGYNVQSCYGSDIPEHPLKIATTTRFFNNEDRGTIFPTFNKNTTKNNTVLLDSWITGGYACVGHLGVLKSQDNGVETVVNSDGILKNTNPDAGIPLLEQDGLIAGNTNQLIVAGLSDGPNGLNALLDNTNDAPLGAALITNNGLWGILEGSVGPDPNENIVLIGQFTTDGDFSFELNFQIGKVGVVEQYVARNREGDELTIPSLIYPIPVNSGDYFGNNQKFELSPSIVSDFISIPELGEDLSKGKFEIFDASGALVLCGSIDNLFNNNINIESLASGLHFLRIFNSSKSKLAKFIKM
jgi:hypothetical protein